MRAILRYFLLTSLCLALMVWVAGCHANQPPATASQNPNGQPGGTPQGADTANLAPVAAGGTGAQAAPYPQTAQGASPGYSSGQADQNQEDQDQDGEDQYLPPSQDTADETEYGIQPEETASEPPPSLPEYDQPPCPGDGYMWTPGYWYWGNAGYYWVPGAWVQAPYEGALWTPGYWGYHDGRYAFFQGYWGRYIGFYGGIDYGHGYTGYGYRGGYWRDGRFDYNRSVNNININIVHNVYTYNVRDNGTQRVSYNGGRGGVEARPRVRELAALRDPHAPPMGTQLQLRRQFGGDRGQFASANHGRPQQAAYARPVAREQGVMPRQEPVRNLPAAVRPATGAAGGQPGQFRIQPGRRERQPVESGRPVQNQLGPPRESSRQNEPVYPEGNHPQVRQPLQTEPQRQERYPVQVEGAPQQQPPQQRTAPVRPQPRGPEGERLPRPGPVTRRPGMQMPREQRPQPERQQPGPEQRAPNPVRPEQRRPEQRAPEQARPEQRAPEQRGQEPNRGQESRPAPEHRDDRH